MSRVKEFYFNEIDQIDEDTILDIQYQEWLEQKKIEDKQILDFYEKNKEQIEGKKIFNLTNTYPF